MQSINLCSTKRRKGKNPKCKPAYMMLDKDDKHCTISELAHFHRAVTHWRQQSLGLTHALNNIPSALVRKKTGFKIKGFLQQELWCWTVHRWYFLERFQFPTNNLRHHLICNSLFSLSWAATNHTVGLGGYSPVCTYRWAPSRTRMWGTVTPLSRICPSQGLPWVWLRWVLTQELGPSLPANIMQLQGGWVPFSAVPTHLW